MATVVAAAVVAEAGDAGKRSKFMRATGLATAGGFLSWLPALLLARLFLK